ncbi:uncharacterized protein DSM5745_01365 [Aspergillus mulundensis]|uniref:Major facilitator superfamily (MFS) profile domain-containing protein n=1 Tax=Aspergillus mulundensis TaxID=1810919 RepID=A0A3D8T666_9EURO|nr:hypothetical protein DSM5745_01365 [Aspergillus mulundensis]RDW94043.1 hypothetical protein DSM5745_01365 [Aspergillus mulundensis]
MSSSETVTVDESAPFHISTVEYETPNQRRSSFIETVANGAVVIDQEKFGVRTRSREASAPSSLPADAPPDGGLRAWSTVVGAWCGMFVSFGWISCIGVFIDYYKAHQLRDGPFVGIIFDNFGPRWVLLSGSFLHLFGLMMISISSKYYQFLLAQGICSPIGTSALFHISINCVNTWFRRRRALALGITVSGSGFGGIIFPIMLARITQLVDFGWAIRTCAFTSLFLLIITNGTIRSRLKHKRRSPLCHPLDFLRPLREIPFVLTSAASYLLAILNAGSIPGRILPPYIADHLGRFNLMILTTLACIILVLALWLPSRSNGPAIAFAVLYGFTGGSAVSLAPALVAQISDIRQIGVRSGTYFAIAAFAALTGTPIAGALLPEPLSGSYLGMELFCAGSMAVAVVFYGVARGIVPGGGWGLRVRV